MTKLHIGTIYKIELYFQCNAKKMNCGMIFTIINYHGTKCLSNLLQVEPCNVMFNVIPAMQSK